MDAAIASHGMRGAPKVLYVVPVGGNPTGAPLLTKLGASDKAMWWAPGAVGTPASNSMREESHDGTRLHKTLGYAGTDCAHRHRAGRKALLRRQF